MDIPATIPVCPRLISSKEVCRRTSLSRASLYRLIAQNAFPKPVALHGARKAWVEPEIDAWMRILGKADRVSDRFRTAIRRKPDSDPRQAGQYYDEAGHCLPST